MVIPGNVPLFEGIEKSDLEHLLTCLAVHDRLYAKGSVILSEGEETESLGIVLSGSVQVYRHDVDGTRIILTEIGRSGVFAESFVCAGIPRSPVGVVAGEITTILFMPFSKMIHTCRTACTFHSRLIENMMHLIARKNLMLNKRLEIVGKRTIREKILGYVRQELKGSIERKITIPFSRTEFADFLCADRSALSREMGIMAKENILKIDGRTLTLL